MNNSDLNALIDQALLDMSNTEAPSSEEASVMEYSEEDFAKMLADIQSEDEDLAKAEIDAAANPDDDENSDFSIASISLYKISLTFLLEISSITLVLSSPALLSSSIKTSKSLKLTFFIFIPPIIKVFIL